MTSLPTSPRRRRHCRHHAARTSPSAGCRLAQRDPRATAAVAAELVLPGPVLTIAPPPAQLAIELDEARIAQQIEAIAETDFFRELAGKAADMRASLRAAGDDREPARLAA